MLKFYYIRLLKYLWYSPIFVKSLTPSPAVPLASFAVYLPRLLSPASPMMASKIKMNLMARIIAVFRKDKKIRKGLLGATL